MKTRINEFQRKQEKSNRIMMVVMLICGMLLLASGFIRAESLPTKADTNNYVLLKSIEARFATVHTNTLEVDKLRMVILNNKQTALAQALGDLTDIEEPGMLFEDIANITDFQKSYFNENNDKPFVTRENTYLIELYALKNEEVFASLEKKRSTRELIAMDNEKDLALESWMLDNNLSTSNKAWNDNFEEFLSNLLDKKIEEVDREIEANRILNDFLALDSEDEPLKLEAFMMEDFSPSPINTGIAENRYLLELLAAKNEAVFKAIEFERMYMEFLAETREEPLELEDWMIDERCWCLKKKQSNHLYSEPYAMNNND